jgi:hypothetical protein
VGTFCPVGLVMTLDGYRPNAEYLLSSTYYENPWDILVEKAILAMHGPQPPEAFSGLSEFINRWDDRTISPTELLEIVGVRV